MRKLLFWLHLGIGVSSGIVIFIMSVTGVLLAYERQIIAWADRDYQIVPQADAQRLPLAELLAHAPTNGAPPSALLLRSDRRLPAELSYGRGKTIYLNTYDGRVLGEGSKATREFFNQIMLWHRWMGASGANRPTGKAISGVCNLAFLGLVMSGMYLWIPKQWSRKHIRPVAWFRSGLHGKARDFNWHNVIGIWCAVPLFFVVLTAVPMSYTWATNLIYQATGSAPPPQQGRPVEGTGTRRRVVNEVDTVQLEKIWLSAERQVPGWQTLSLRLPVTSSRPLSFAADTGNGGQPDHRLQFMVDPATASVGHVETFSSYSLGRQLRSYARFVHTGEQGGIVGQTIAAIASLGGAFLVWTGISLALRRLRAWSTARQRSR